MRRIIPIISLLLFFAGATFGQNTVSIADVTSPDGTDVLVPVSITALDSVGSVNMNIQYDTNVATFTSIDNNVLTGNFVVNDNNGVIQIAWFSVTPVDLSGKVFDINFSYTSGSSALAFTGTNEIADQVGDPYPVTFVDGSIGPEPATMSLSTAFGVPDEVVTIDLDASNLKNIGAMNIYIDYDPAVAEYLGLGDVNLPNFTTGTTPGTINLGMFNASGFNHVTGLLAELEFKIISGTEDLVFDQVQSVVEQVDFTVVPIVYSDGRIGEVDPSFVLGDAEGFVDSEVSVPFNGLKLENIGSFNIDITFDTDVLEFVRVENVVSGSLVGNEDSPGVLSLGYINTSGLTVVDGKVADIVFMYSGGTTDVDWDAGSAIIEDVQFNPLTVSFINGSVSEASAPILYEFAEYATDGTLDQTWVINQWAGDAGSNIFVADSTASSWGSHVVVYEDSGFTGLAHVRELALVNYTVSADIYLVGEADPDFNLYTGVGIKMASDAGEYYRMVFRNSSSSAHGQIRLQGYDGANFHISQYWEPGVDFTPITTGWHNFKIKVEGETFWCYLDDELLPGGPYTNPSPFLELGYAGMYKYNAGYGNVVFDNFEVKSTELPPAQKSVAINTIQQGQNASNQYTDQAIQTWGVITGANSNGYFMQDGSGAWNGVWVFNPGHSFVMGDSVAVTGFVTEYFNKTEILDVVSAELLGTGSDVLPVILSTGQVNDEMYESVVVGVMGATVTNPDLGFGEWEIDDGTGPARVDDLFVSWTPVLNEEYVVIGVNDYTFDNFKIAPRDSSEIVRMTGPEELLGLDHTPGSYSMTAINDGNIGALSGLGVGMTWDGANGLWRSALVFGRASVGSASGDAHQNSIGFADLTNIQSDFASGFTSDANFDQISEAVVSDGNADNPYGYHITQKTMSNTGDNFVYYAYGFTNDTQETVDDLWAGMFIDYDVGAGNAYLSNLGGVALGEHLVYQYYDESNPYFGAVALTGVEEDWGGSVQSGNLDDVAAFRQAALGYISNTDVTDPGISDQRTWIGSKFASTGPGETNWVYIAFTAGDNLHDIRANAAAAVNKARGFNWTNFVTDVGDDVLSNIPEDFSIAQNYPNPFNPSTTIKYGLPASSQVKITVYNTLGEVIDVLVNRDQAAGYYEVNWNASKLASGVYFYSIQAQSDEAGKDFAVVKKMMLLK